MKILNFLCVAVAHLFAKVSFLNVLKAVQRLSLELVAVLASEISEV